MLTRLFYLIKPFIPRRIQFSLRRLVIRLNLKKNRHVWPIKKEAGVKPEWFSAWPDNKKFVLIVTHDVELNTGLEKIEKLIKIDEKYGINSSVGLIPERYTVTDELLELLRSRNRGIYVHDLNHDGKLFSNYTVFHQRAPEINRYLHDWNVNGFRAGAMHHNLEWIGELDIRYDMSTFDTDPFEPMPDGVDTIFPFVASSSSTGNSYVEIPYTLPQDLLVLVLHPEKSTDIWKRKLDWIVQHSGMASVNVHPDYMYFSEEKKSFDNYPYRQYEDFLSYIVDRYSAILWNPFPEELSSYISTISHEFFKRHRHNNSGA